MKRNLLKKIAAWGLCLCMPMSFAPGAFADGSETYDCLKYTRRYTRPLTNPQNIVFSIKNDNGFNCLVNAVGRELNADDFSYKALGNTEIIIRPNGVINFFSPCCSVKAMCLFAALYVLGYDEFDISDFLVDFKDDFSIENVLKVTFTEILKNRENKNVRLAINLASSIK